MGDHMPLSVCSIIGERTLLALELQRTRTLQAVAILVVAAEGFRAFVRSKAQHSVKASCPGVAYSSTNGDERTPCRNISIDNEVAPKHSIVMYVDPCNLPDCMAVPFMIPPYKL